jgi:beta-N-acetylhexosaminidase
MTDEELFAQILMFGWAGQEPSELLNRWVLERGLGSVKLFGWNTDNTMQVARSVTALQTKAETRRFKIPLFVATDQEGGIIRHVKGDTSNTPGNLAIGASGYPMDAWYSGYYIGRELKALGINMNFAPTIDLYSSLDSSVIGPRSFGDNPEAAGVLGALFAAGTQAAGVIPTAKHFPGHGDTGVDSHGRLPAINVDRETFLNREVTPFRYVINEGIAAIMSGHLSFPRILPDGEPASLSKTMLTGFLRGELGFQGLIITDDMRMNGAIVYTGNLSSAYRMAIEAGNDIIISSTTAALNEALWQQNLALMRASPEFRARVTDAARRVLYAKLVYFKSENSVPVFPDMEKIPSLVPDREGEPFFLNLACRSITLAKQGKAFPYRSAPGERVLLAGQFPAFFDAGSSRYPAASVFRFVSGAADTSSRLAQAAAASDTVILCVADEESAALARQLQNSGKTLVVISVTSPVPAFNLDRADTVLYAYSTSPYSLEAAFGVLAGEFVPRGVLPITR